MTSTRAPTVTTSVPGRTRAPEPSVRPGGPPAPAVVSILSPMATKATKGPGGSHQKGRSAQGRAGAPTRSNDRYTPPVPKGQKKSPPWMGVLIIALFLLGAVVVILDYLDFLPGGVSSWWLVAAIGLVFAALMVATRYH